MIKISFAFELKLQVELEPSLLPGASAGVDVKNEFFPGIINTSLIFLQSLFGSSNEPSTWKEMIELTSFENQPATSSYAFICLFEGKKNLPAVWELNSIPVMFALNLPS